MLRLDLLPAWASGNKYFKLKPYLQAAIENGIRQIISKGGMFSNHLDALAQACHHFGFDLVCLVRSYQPDLDNPTIKRLSHHGAAVHSLAPDQYASYDEVAAARDFPDGMFIPEGGLSATGLDGSAYLGKQINALNKDHVLIMGGTLCTALGMASALDAGKHVHIIPAWKGCTLEYVAAICRTYELDIPGNIQLWPDYHVGGFGKWDEALLDFMIEFTTNTGIPLDPVYTGKMMYAFFDLVSRKQIDPQHVLLIHTGGLQGVEGFAYRWADAWLPYAMLIKKES